MIIKPLLEYMSMYDSEIDGDIAKFAIIDMLEDLKNQMNANTEAIKLLQSLSPIERNGYKPDIDKPVHNNVWRSKQIIPEEPV